MSESVHPKSVILLAATLAVGIMRIVLESRSARVARSLFLLLVCVSSTIAATQASPKVIKRLDGTEITANVLSARIQTLMEQADVHGLAISVFNHGQIVYNKAFGVKRADTKEPLR